jgi:hypothetical protein
VWNSFSSSGTGLPRFNGLSTGPAAFSVENGRSRTPDGRTDEGDGLENG